MGGMSTDELVSIALELAGMRRLPPDSEVYVPGERIERLLVALDVGTAELLLARSLGCDGVLAHHPAGGRAVLRFPEVLTRHVELMVEQGVEPTAAKAALQPLLARTVLRAQAANYDQVPAVARILRLPFLNLHLPLDEIGRRIIVETIERYRARLERECTVQDVIEALQTLPEFAEAETRIMVPVGAIDRPARRIAVVHGAGTNGGAAVAQAYFDHGIDTVIYLHLAPEEAERLRASQTGTVIVLGHVAGDRIGINRYLAEVERHGVEVVRIGI
ncbi:MAG: Nif3-like dinuclear metal center hexameric protein [Thermomicrobium sp.]|nr:Nif3-like dinuclear metal center hexameric protein [Thermomicrobium sp.]MDW8059769.1 Nif3-like dinuclear metal center hexameric protein [Thermomicrobium sp.]